MTGLYIDSEPDKIYSDLIRIGHNNFCSTDIILTAMTELYVYFKFWV